MNADLEKEYAKALSEEPDTEKERDDEYDATLNRILELLPDRKFVQARTVLLENNEADIAELLEDVTEEEGLDKAVILFRILPKDISVDVFSFFSLDMQVDIIRAITDKEISFIMQELDFDDMIDVLDELPANIVDKILARATKEERKQINTFLNYPDNSAGSLMTPGYISLRKSWTVREALECIREKELESETIYTCYVMDQGRKLIGIVSLRRLVTAKESQLVGDLMEEDFVAAGVLEDQESVSEQFKKYDLLAMPVVDKEDRLVGIITVDDIMDVIEEETTEDIERMAAMLPSEKEYLRANAFDIFKQRIPWLMLLMVSATFTGTIITKFESALAAQVVLTAFIPMLMDTGGNSGSQASVTIIRALSLNEVEFKNLPAVIWKEVQTAVLCGACLALLCFGKLLLVDRLLLGNAGVTVPVAFVVCVALAVTVLVAKVVGCIFPLLADRLGFDPAVMSSPFITTVVDALSLLVYFGFARALLLR